MFNVIISGSQQNGVEEKLIRPITEALHKLLISENLVQSFLVPLFEGDDELALYRAIMWSNNLCAELGDSDGSKSRHFAVHSDGGYKGSGAMGIYFSANGKAFIVPILQKIMDATPWPDMGLRQRSDLGELKNTTAIAGLLELSFHDNSEQLAWMQNNVDTIANLLKLGIYDSLGIVYPVKTNNDVLEKRITELTNLYYSLKKDILDVTTKYI
jgi:hypothetical protein